MRMAGCADGKPGSRGSSQQWASECRVLRRRRWRSSLRPSDCTTASSSETAAEAARSEEHTSELQSLMRTSYAVFCLKKNRNDPREVLRNAGRFACYTRACNASEGVRIKPE